MTFAGDPTARQPSGRLDVTSEFTPTTQFRPIRTPGLIVAPGTHVKSPISTPSKATGKPCSRLG